LKKGKTYNNTDKRQILHPATGEKQKITRVQNLNNNLPTCNGKALLID